MCVIFLDRCWVVHIPLVRMVKFKFLAHLPVDHFALPTSELFTPTSVDVFPKEYEWHQVYLGHQDSPPYSIVWMVSICLLILNNSSSLSKSLGTVPSASITIGITVTLMFYNFFRVLWQSPSTCLLFCFLRFSHCSPPERQSPLDGMLFFFVFNNH